MRPAPDQYTLQVEREERHQLTHENPVNMAWCCADNCPCTGVNVGCSFVNSSSKLLVSAVPFYNVPSLFSAQPVRRVKRGSYNRGAVRRGYTLVEYIVPAHVLEEWLPLDLLRVPLSGTKPAVGISSKELQSVGSQWPRRGTEKRN